MLLFTFCIFLLPSTTGGAPGQCPGDSGFDYSGSIGDPCSAGRYCDNELRISSRKVCCDCATPGFYCPGHLGEEFSSACWGENEAGDNAPKRQCPAGTISSGQRTSVCAPCPSGKFGERAKRASLLTEKKNEATNHTHTIPICAASNNNCNNCPAGKYSFQSSSSCATCEAGKFNPEVGQTECESCSAGKYVSLPVGFDYTDWAGCSDCPPNSHSPPGSASCNNCLAGEQPTDFNRKSTTNTLCEGCMRLCDICQSGKINEVPGLLCRGCGNGHYNTVDLSQGPVQQSTTNHDSFVDDCTPCELGKFNELDAASECVDCPVGTFASRAGQGSCSNCPSGKASSEVGQVANNTCGECDQTLIGYEFDEVGLETCKTIKCAKGGE